MKLDIQTLPLSTPSRTDSPTPSSPYGPGVLSNVVNTCATSHPTGVACGRQIPAANCNHFDTEPYRTNSTRNYEFETQLGKALKSDPRLVDIAKRIRSLTGAPSYIAAFDEHERDEIRGMKHIGGAHELSEDIDTLDAHVLATLIKAERREYNIDRSATEYRDKRYIVNLDRRLCMFNAAPKDNIIAPWNTRDFDLEIYKVTQPEQYPARLSNLIADRWTALLATKPDPNKFVQDDLGLEGLDANAGVFHVLGSLDESARKTLLCDDLRIPWSTEEDILDENDNCPTSPTRLTNPLGSQFRQHKTGARSNVVRYHDPADPVVNAWVVKAMELGKPVISGPSGHTLRYLNHYAMCKEMVGYSKSGVADWPTLAEARLVMLANLIPPKNHHSFHEIMLASVGVTDGTETLRYQHMEDYEDLASHPIGRDALDVASMTPARPPDS
ncbi:hypothetical protein [Pinirhizobacter soli]|uniref:hypothetical protein n=1 Tax=Pinirhizobacter soli TaxID=2786953 RepID=UPI00202AB519|nr:hypothetical protein [Pinirhizobacter soli]